MKERMISKLLTLTLVVGIVSAAATPIAANAAEVNTTDAPIVLPSKPNSSIETKGWKSAAVKKAAKWLAGVIGSKSVADITDYLFEWQDDLEAGCENFLVDECGWDEDVAHWTVKTASFIFL